MDNPNQLDKHDFDDWKSWPPDEVLLAFINELRGRLVSIKGYAQLIAINPSEEFRAKSTTNIIKIVERLEGSMQDVLSYLNDYQEKDKK